MGKMLQDYRGQLESFQETQQLWEQPHTLSLLPIQPPLPTHNHRLPLQGLLSKQGEWVGGAGVLTPPIALLTGPPLGAAMLGASHVGSLTAGGFTDVR